MNGCFIKNNFGQSPRNSKSSKAQPITLKKKVTGGLNFHSPTNQVQRSVPWLEASACILAQDARSALSGQDRLGSMPGKGRLCVCHEGWILFRESPGLGRVKPGQEAQHLIRTCRPHYCDFRSVLTSQPVVLTGYTFTSTFLKVRCVLQFVTHYSYRNFL